MKKSFILFIGALLLIVCIGFSYTNKDPVVEGLGAYIGSNPAAAVGSCINLSLTQSFIHAVATDTARPFTPSSGGAFEGKYCYTGTKGTGKNTVQVWQQQKNHNVYYFVWNTFKLLIQTTGSAATNMLFAAIGEIFAPASSYPSQSFQQEEILETIVSNNLGPSIMWRGPPPSVFFGGNNVLLIGHRSSSSNNVPYNKVSFTGQVLSVAALPAHTASPSTAAGDDMGCPLGWKAPGKVAGYYMSSAPSVVSAAAATAPRYTSIALPWSAARQRVASTSDCAKYCQNQTVATADVSQYNTGGSGWCGCWKQAEGGAGEKLFVLEQDASATSSIVCEKTPEPPPPPAGSTASPSPAPAPAPVPAPAPAPKTPSNASICAAAFNECQTLSSAAGGGGAGTPASSSTTAQPTQPAPTQPAPTHSRTPNPDVAANASEISTLKNELQTLQQQENQLEIDMGAGSGPINHTGARYSGNPKGSGTINFKCING